MTVRHARCRFDRGVRISAEEVENLILAHPAVMQAAVVAIPDRVRGERVCMFLVARQGAGVTRSEWNQFLLGRGLARFEFPERVETIAGLPLTNVGKVDKKAVREMATGTIG